MKINEKLAEMDENGSQFKVDENLSNGLIFLANLFAF